MQRNIKQLVQTHARRVWLSKVLDCVASQTREEALESVTVAVAAGTYPAIANIVLHTLTGYVTSMKDK